MPYGFKNYLTTEAKFNPDTAEEYASVVEHFFKHLQIVKKTDVDIKDVKPSDIRQFLKMLSARNQPSTINKKLSILKRFFDYAERKGIIPYFDPAAKIERIQEPKNNQIRPYEWFLEQYNRLLELPDVPSEYKAVMILSLHGAIPSDFLLRHDQVTLQDEKVILQTPNRVIILEAAYAKNFREYYKNSLKIESPFVFTRISRKGTIEPINTINLTKILKKIAKLLTIEQPFTFTEVRKSYMEYLYRAHQMPMMDIAKLFNLHIVTVTETISAVQKTTGNKKTHIAHENLK
jgi:integrase